jgi:rhamnogalacturonyl hydrolase YesR
LTSRARARELADALIRRQRDDGSWMNRFTDGREDDPLVATPMAADALLNCRAMLKAEPTTHADQ